METKIDEAVEAIRSDHMAIMGSQAEMEKALRELLEKAEQAPSGLYDSCQKEVQNVLEVMFEKLEPSAQKFLVTAEWGYQNYPMESDFSGVIIGFTKVYEVQFKRAIEPFRESLQNLLDAEAKENKKTSIDILSFGPLLGLFKRNKASLKPEFEKRDLSLEEVIKNTELVNKEKEAKHTKPRAKVDATSFRTLFLGANSVLEVLLSKLT